MFPTISQDALTERQRANDASLVVLDVRSAAEFDEGHVPGARNIPHDRVVERLAELPADKDLVVYCRSGGRARRAAEDLAARGYTRLLHLEGDMSAWLENRRPVETVQPAASPD